MTATTTNRQQRGRRILNKRTPSSQPSQSFAPGNWNSTGHITHSISTHKQTPKIAEKNPKKTSRRRRRPATGDQNRRTGTGRADLGEGGSDGVERDDGDGGGGAAGSEAAPGGRLLHRDVPRRLRLRHHRAAPAAVYAPEFAHSLGFSPPVL